MRGGQEKEAATTPGKNKKKTNAEDTHLMSNPTHVDGQSLVEQS